MCDRFTLYTLCLETGRFKRSILCVTGNEGEIQTTTAGGLWGAYLTIFGGFKIPTKASPRGPESSTPRAQKRSPRAIPNDSRVGQISTSNFSKNDSKRQARKSRKGQVSTERWCTVIKKRYLYYLQLARFKKQTY